MAEFSLPIFDDPELQAHLQPIADSYNFVGQAADQVELENLTSTIRTSGLEAMRAHAQDFVATIGMLPLANNALAEEMATVEDGYRPVLKAAETAGLTTVAEQTAAELDTRQSQLVNDRKTYVVGLLREVFGSTLTLPPLRLPGEPLDIESIEERARQPLPLLTDKQIELRFDTRPFTQKEVEIFVNDHFRPTMSRRVSTCALLKGEDLAIGERDKGRPWKLTMHDELDMHKLIRFALNGELSDPEFPWLGFGRDFGRISYKGMKMFILSREKSIG